MEKDKLENFINEGKSTYDMCKIMGCGQTTIRYWLKKYNLKTNWKPFHLKERFGTKQICKKHGLAEYSTGKELRCRKCTVEAVLRKREKLKITAVEYKGGKCQVCGYNKYVGALEFHHINPEDKEFNISHKGYTRSWEKVKKEIDKCYLLCANCHRELHAKLFELP